MGCDLPSATMRGHAVNGLCDRLGASFVEGLQPRVEGLGRCADLRTRAMPSCYEGRWHLELSSDSRDRSEEPHWQQGVDPMAWDGWTEDGSMVVGHR